MLTVRPRIWWSCFWLGSDCGVGLHGLLVNNLGMARIRLFALRCILRRNVSRDVFLGKDWCFTDWLWGLGSFRLAVLTWGAVRSLWFPDFDYSIHTIAPTNVLLTSMWWGVLQQLWLALAKSEVLRGRWHALKRGHFTVRLDSRLRWFSMFLLQLLEILCVAVVIRLDVARVYRFWLPWFQLIYNLGGIFILIV